MNENAIMALNDLTTNMIRPYRKVLDTLAFERKKPSDGSFLRRITRTTDNVSPSSDPLVGGYEVELDFITRMPWGIRGMTEKGYTPTSSAWATARQTARLSCIAVATPPITLSALTCAELDREKTWGSLIERSMQAIRAQIPVFFRAWMYASKDSYKAIAKFASISGLTVTPNNSSLNPWTAVKDRCRMIEDGMFLQVYRSGSKVGAPVMVTSVSHSLGTFTIDADPGLTAGDLFVPCDGGGLDVPFSSEFPGILDIIADDNVFQGTDRSLATNSKFRANIRDFTSLTLNRKNLEDWFSELKDPAVAFTSRKVLEKYYTDNIHGQVQFMQAMNYQDGTPSITIGTTKLAVDDELPQNEIWVDDGGIRMASAGEMKDLFDNGWTQIPGRPMMELVQAMFELTHAEDTRYMGRAKNIQGIT